MLRRMDSWVSWAVPTIGVLTGTLIASLRRHESRAQIVGTLGYALVGCAVAILLWAVLMWAAVEGQRG
jgi:hypothetical protein